MIDGYSRVAHLYEVNIEPVFEPLARRLVQIANPEKGQQVLDVGTGTGLAARLAGELVGPTGTVLGIDLSQGMLSLATEKSQRLLYKNIEFRKMDETSLRLPDDGFDAVIANLGLTPARTGSALREIRRVLRPKGVFAFNEWTGKTSKPETIFRETLMGYRTRTPSSLLSATREALASRLPGWKMLYDGKLLSMMLRQAGFRDVTLTKALLQVTVASVESFIRCQQSWWTISQEMVEMGPEVRKEFLEKLTGALEPLASPSGILLDWELNYFTAYK
jgi:ubiquinone/menaquinone biosynthesis C-methylase UbiE